jgi:hypothetical protein
LRRQRAERERETEAEKKRRLKEGARKKSRRLPKKSENRRRRRRRRKRPQRTDGELDPLSSLAALPPVSAPLRHRGRPVRPCHERHLPPGVGRGRGQRAEGLCRERADLCGDGDGARDEERALARGGGRRGGSGSRRSGGGFSGLYFPMFFASKER